MDSYLSSGGPHEPDVKPDPAEPPHPGPVSFAPAQSARSRTKTADSLTSSQLRRRHGEDDSSSSLRLHGDLSTPSLALLYRGEKELKKRGGGVKGGGGDIRRELHKRIGGSRISGTPDLLRSVSVANKGSSHVPRAGGPRPATENVSPPLAEYKDSAPAGQRDQRRFINKPHDSDAPIPGTPGFIHLASFTWLHSPGFIHTWLHSPGFIHLASFTWLHSHLASFTWLHSHLASFTWLHSHLASFTWLHSHLASSCRLSALQTIYTRGPSVLFLDHRLQNLKPSTAQTSMNPAGTGISSKVKPSNPNVYQKSEEEFTVRSEFRTLPDERQRVSHDSALQTDGAPLRHLLALQLLEEAGRSQRSVGGRSSGVLRPHGGRRLRALGRRLSLPVGGRHRGGGRRALGGRSLTPGSQIAAVGRGGVLLRLLLRVSRRSLEDGRQLLDEGGGSAAELRGGSGPVVQLQAFVDQPGFVLLGGFGLVLHDWARAEVFSRRSGSLLLGCGTTGGSGVFRVQRVAKGLQGQVQAAVYLFRTQEGGEICEVPVSSVIQLRHRVRAELPVGGRLGEHPPVALRGPASCRALEQGGDGERQIPAPVLHPGPQRTHVYTGL
ncbi:hypothetical protein EYF80_051559 [Liparis tanakae]|uniref:Uncharacterized protein n=1 Tax=Liparis tanakae TaxID=230148 RepID=A0A4Z2FBG0_9TELE|nr:hypothetical protein EYF80_051559 [Liparis tanakae]